MDPILDVMKDPTFPAIIIEIIVGANSNIIISLVAYPIRYFAKIADYKQGEYFVKFLDDE